PRPEEPAQRVVGDRLAHQIRDGHRQETQRLADLSPAEGTKGVQQVESLDSVPGGGRRGGRRVGSLEGGQEGGPGGGRDGRGGGEGGGGGRRRGGPPLHPVAAGSGALPPFEPGRATA